MKKGGKLKEFTRHTEHRQDSTESEATEIKSVVTQDKQPSDLTYLGQQKHKLKKSSKEVNKAVNKNTSTKL